MAKVPFHVSRVGTLDLGTPNPWGIAQDRVMVPPPGTTSQGLETPDYHMHFFPVRGLIPVRDPEVGDPLFKGNSQHVKNDK